MRSEVKLNEKLKMNPDTFIAPRYPPAEYLCLTIPVCKNIQLRNNVYLIQFVLYYYLDLYRSVEFDIQLFHFTREKDCLYSCKW